MYHEASIDDLKYIPAENHICNKRNRYLHNKELFTFSDLHTISLGKLSETQ